MNSEARSGSASYEEFPRFEFWEIASLNLVLFDAGYLVLRRVWRWIISLFFGFLAAILGFIIFFWLYDDVFCVETAASKKGGTYCVRRFAGAQVLAVIIAVVPYVTVRLIALKDAWNIASDYNWERKRRAKAREEGPSHAKDQNARSFPYVIL
ncbi:MAG: hypothetical protein FJ320_12030 [SAR202 cluster bacterium]|nr:hypothetical protein [SAR202 cluster bacterium]